jgi:TrmH family RNA methyltransferase
MKITSVNNDLIKETAKLLQKKYREDSGLFLLEGSKCIEEALHSGLEVLHIFSTEGFDEYSQRIEVTEAVLSKISEAKSAPKAVAVAKQLTTDINELKSMSKVVLLDGIKDAGNLGTILRASAAFGINGVVLFGDTVDLYNPKCVRASVGNLWKIKIYKIKDIEILKDLFNGFERIATLPRGDKVINLSDYKNRGKTLVMFGSEADGLCKNLKDFATKNITIEMLDNVESLNLSVSAGIVLYKIFMS